MMANGRIPLLVLGGGIGGVAAALSLARRGRRVHVLEKAPELAEIGAGLQLAPNAMRVLDWLGILERIKSAAVFPQTLNLLDIVTAKRLKTVDLGPAFIARYGYPYIVMHRSDLLTILVKACRDSGLVSFETSKDAVAIEDLRDSAEVTCGDGSVYRTDALIAADGLWSLARRTLFSDDQVHTPKYVAYRGTIPISEVAMYARPDDLLIWAGPEMHLGSIRSVVESSTIRSPSSRVIGTAVIATIGALRKNWTVTSRRPAPMCSRPSIRLAAAVVGRCSTATLSSNGPGTGWSCSEMRPIQCCSFSRRERVRPLKTPSALQIAWISMPPT